MTHKSLNRVKAHSRIMTKSEIRLVSAKEYRDMKAMVNKYERTWRKKNPEKHKAESKALLSAIMKNKTPQKKVKKIAKKVKKAEPKQESQQVAQ